MDLLGILIYAKIHGVWKKKSSSTESYKSRYERWCYPSVPKNWANKIHSFNSFIEIVNSVLDKNMPWKKWTKILLEAKTWSTLGIMNSIKCRELYSKDVLPVQRKIGKNYFRPSIKFCARIVALIKLANRTTTLPWTTGKTYF